MPDFQQLPFTISLTPRRKGRKGKTSKLCDFAPSRETFTTRHSLG
jgi:hypothetical protein